ncbi:MULTISPECIES: LytTR family DNA-binding domain-containing protein [Sphingomonas]|nr:MULTISPECIES: LytTR family DNA-binding domain-containing protein [Sphingomonas]MBA2918084.1 LytTR family transcriptional regulator [Sphingomonas sp. CGMCC 1.13658]
MQFTQRQRPSWGSWRPFLAAIPVGLLLGFAGPFGSYPAFPTATRYAFWLGLTAAGAVAVVAANAVLPMTRRRAGAIRIGAVALVSALPMTFVVAWTMSLVQPGRFYTPQQLPALFAAVTAVQLLIAYATTVIAPGSGDAGTPGRAPVLPEPEEPEPEEDAIPAAYPSALLSRLPPGIGGEIIALETEDHYLRVHALGGSALILMRMADAVALLDPKLGAQVHRRWWVAHTAVAGVRIDGQRLSLCLTDNSLVPVGRTFSTAVKARFAHARNIGRAGRLQPPANGASADGV